MITNLVKGLTFGIIHNCILEHKITHIHQHFEIHNLVNNVLKMNMVKANMSAVLKIIFMNF